jgi:MFS family permease
MSGEARPSARWALVAMLAVYFCSFFQRTAVPGTIFNEIQREWGLSATGIAALGSVFLWVYGGMQLVVGVLADRLGGTRTLMAGGVLLAAGSLLFPLSSSVTMLYITRALTAVGDSCVFLCIAKELSLLFEPRRFAALLGVTLFVGYSGGMAAMLPFERAVHHLGWRQALTVMGVLTAAVVALAGLVLRRLDHFTPPRERFTLQPIGGLLRNRANWPVFTCSFINFPIYFTIQVGLGKKFLQDYAGLDSRAAAGFTLAMMTVSAVTALLAGPVLSRSGGRRKPVMYASVGLTLGAALLLLAGVLLRGGPAVFLAGYLILALANVFGPVSSAMVRELNDSRYVAQAIALLNTLAYAGVAVALGMSGLVLDLFRRGARETAEGLVYPPAAYAALLAVLAGLAVIPVVASRYARETGGAKGTG